MVYLGIGSSLVPKMPSTTCWMPTSSTRIHVTTQRRMMSSLYWVMWFVVSLFYISLSTLIVLINVFQKLFLSNHDVYCLVLFEKERQKLWFLHACSTIEALLQTILNQDLCNSYIFTCGYFDLYGNQKHTIVKLGHFWHTNSHYVKLRGGTSSNLFTFLELC